MIGSQLLRGLARPGELLAVDLEGGPIGIDGLVDPASPGLVVAPVTEAVKEVDDGTVVQYVNRDTLWAVHGFVVDHELVSLLPDQVDGPESLISAVVELGRNWSPVHLSTDPPE